MLWSSVVSQWLRIHCQYRRHGFDTWVDSTCQCNPWVGKIPWRKKWQPTPVFLPGKSHEQRSLVGYNPWGRKESDRTERLNSNTCFKMTELHFLLRCVLASTFKVLLMNLLRVNYLDHFQQFTFCQTREKVTWRKRQSFGLIMYRLPPRWSSL